jgi:hypothetical protein
MGASLPTRIEVCFDAMETSQFTFSQKFKVTPLAGNINLTVFCDSQKVLLAHFQKCGENVNSASYFEVLLKFRDANSRKQSSKMDTASS